MESKESDMTCKLKQQQQQHSLNRAGQAPLSIEFLKQGYWSGLPFPSSGDLPDPGIEHTSSAETELDIWSNVEKIFKRDVEWHLLPELSVELEIVIIRHDNLFFRHLAGQQEKA
ncbi:hypothetical protein MG293_000921 [Ovis ammon polii]|uniref:Uncharacterized protein n=1 Tax=Ovis ammon polii TaxID=230172 RepID=A0AAD4YIW0_OVIAM|nr:hypothetical protein MG293_000921 [Ovis ammon polii]